MSPRGLSFPVHLQPGLSLAVLVGFRSLNHFPSPLLSDGLNATADEPEQRPTAR